MPKGPIAEVLEATSHHGNNNIFRTHKASHGSFLMKMPQNKGLGMDSYWTIKISQLSMDVKQ